MANKRKHDHSKTAKRISVRSQTIKNKIKKYTDLINKNPNDKQIPIWKQLLEKLK